MIDLEKRLENKSGSVLTDLRKEIQLLIENSAARSESFTEENYKKTLELMLELEKKLD
jgi:hypothetical protein